MNWESKNNNRNLNKIKFLLITALTISLVVYLTFLAGPNKQSREKTLITAITFENIVQLPMSSPPISSSDDAIRWAIKNEAISARIEEVSRNADFVRWNLSAKLLRGSLDLWEVNISSSGMLPSLTCSVYVSRDGEITPIKLDNSLCKYNK